MPICRHTSTRCSAVAQPQRVGDLLFGEPRLLHRFSWPRPGRSEATVPLVLTCMGFPGRRQEGSKSVQRSSCLPSMEPHPRKKTHFPHFDGMRRWGEGWQNSRSDSSPLAPSPRRAKATAPKRSVVNVHRGVIDRMEHRPSLISATATRHHPTHIRPRVLRPLLVGVARRGLAAATSIGVRFGCARS